MNVKKSLRLVMFSYDLFRLLFLAASFTLFSITQSAVLEGIFPYLVYLSSNAIFPLICFFLFLKSAEYKNYLPLYMAAKTIAVVLFYLWAVFSLPMQTGFVNRDNYNEWMMLMGGIFIVSLGDALSIFGIWVLNK